jgi:hypothetical protein
VKPIGIAPLRAHMYFSSTKPLRSMDAETINSGRCYLSQTQMLNDLFIETEAMAFCSVTIHPAQLQPKQFIAENGIVIYSNLVCPSSLDFHLTFICIPFDRQFTSVQRWRAEVPIFELMDSVKIHCYRESISGSVSLPKVNHILSSMT